MPRKLLSVIIVSYNTRDLTVGAVKSVLDEVSQSQLLKGKTEVIIIDNNSSDGSVASLEKIAEKYSKTLQLIKNKNNVGFATANNQGIVASDSDFVLLLNSDTIVQPGALTEMIETMNNYPIDDTTSALTDRPEVLDRLGILAARLLNPDGSAQPQGGSLPNLTSLFFHMMMFDDLPLIGSFFPSTQHTGKRTTITHPNLENRPEPMGWVAATAVMIRRTVLDEIGNLDENIFMYGEDVEYCLRAHHHHWDVAIDPKAEVVHFGSASSSSNNAVIGEMKGYLYIWSKHMPHWQVPIVRLLIRFGAMMRIFTFRVLSKNEQKVAIYQQVLQQVPLYNSV